MFEVSIPEDMAIMAHSIAENFREHVRMEIYCGTDWRMKYDAMIVLEKLADGKFDSAAGALGAIDMIITIHKKIEKDAELAELYPELGVFFGMFGADIAQIKRHAQLFADTMEKRQRGRG